ncbi:tetratricopeptide repeat protein [Methanoregula sp.]|uniref:tetratricopeptide repeat protein n=1 Tax=Methanoregula sp. TaxID=2052170 RepID=UPI00236D174D|nr:tetratricopeptide repeat protein [Methanoregula sp.]MDD1686256.1 hypothetical protein [Methanoregula sp.]
MTPIRRFLIITLLLLCLVLPAVSAAASTAAISSAPAVTTGVPPYNVSVYLVDTRAAVLGENWTEVIRVTTRGLAWYPENADLLCQQGYAYRKTGQYQKSVDTVSQAIPLDPKPVRYANRGYGYLALGNDTAALADAEAGIALNATYPVTYGVKALAISGMGKNPEALDAIGTAIALTPDSAHYWHVKGRILAAEGDCAGAAAALEKSIALDPTYTLPYPGFGSAGENLADLNTACAKTASPQATAKSPLGWIAVAGVIGAVIVAGSRR